MKKSGKIWLYALEVVIIIVIVIYLGITKVIPQYQQSIGSSEKLFSFKNYETSVEVNIASGPEFFLIINKNDEVTNIFIENKLASSIVNQDIEGKKIDKAIPEIFQKLIDSNQLDSQIINIINYKDSIVCKKIVSLVKTTLEKKSKTTQIIENTSTLQEKAKLLKIEETDDEQILWTLYLNSTNIIDSISKELDSNQLNIAKESASIYADNIYQKLITYMMNANVQEQDINNTVMPIKYIPGNNENTVYASSNSWYYIKNYKVYAEITIIGKENYTFCYMGSIIDKKEGTC